MGALVTVRLVTPVLFFLLANAYLQFDTTRNAPFFTEHICDTCSLAPQQISAIDPTFMTIYAENTRQEAVNRIVIKALEKSSSTKFVGTTTQNFQEIGHWVKNNLYARHIGVIFDANTRKIAKKNVIPRLQTAGLEYSCVELQDPAPGTPPVCSTALGEHVATRFDESVDVILSVGSGTITDVAKITARTLELPMVAVATAASMNGFTSGLAATLDDGIKLTKKAPPPRAAWALPSTLQEAPAAMTAAGLGDLHSKPISSADWRLSHRLNGAPWDEPVVEMLTTVTELSLGIADGLRASNPDAYAQLFAGLCLTGIAMQAATPGSQASGAEHLVSHYFDMIAGSNSFEHRATHHGAQVAVGCMVSLSAWQFALRAFEENRPLESCPEHIYIPEQRSAWIDGHFRSLGPAIRAMHERSPVSREDVMRRRAVLESTQGEAVQDASTHLPDAQWLRDELQRAGCPTHFSELGVGCELAEQCIRYAPWVRARYTIFHLLLECGWYDAFIHEALLQNSKPL